MIIVLAADGGPGRGSESIRTTADPLRAEEALDWFQQRVPVTRAQWDALDAQARRRAFMVSGVASLDVIEHVWRHIDRAVADGTPFEDFRRGVRTSLEAQWGTDNPGRLDTIFRTNVQAAYAAGRYQQMSDPDVRATRPFWEFVAILDDATTPICRPLEGVVKRADDPWWNTSYPPLHFNCRSTVMTLSMRQGHERLGEQDIEHAGTAAPPMKGFGAAPDLSEWQPREHDYPPDLWRAFQSWQARRAGSGTPPQSAPPAVQPPVAAPPPSRVLPPRARPTPPAVQLPPVPRAPTLAAPERTQPHGPAVSAALTAPSGKGKVPIAVREALAIIDTVHGDGALPTIPVRQTASKNEHGRYTHYKGSGKPFEIGISAQGDHPAFTLCHETGHFLDHQGIGPQGVFASRAHPLLDAWRKAVLSTKAVHQLQFVAQTGVVHIRGADGSIRVLRLPKGYLSYLLSHEELFARSYAQYIARKSQNPRLLTEMNAIRTQPGEVLVPTQWDDDDFAGIEQAFDTLMVTLTWVR